MLRAILAVQVLALTVGACSKSNSKSKDKVDTPVVTQARTGGFQPYAPKETTSVTAVFSPGEDASVAVWKTKVSMPGNAYGSAALLTLSMIPNGLVQTKDLQFVSPLVQFSLTDDVGVVPREKMMKVITIENIVDRFIDEKNTMILVIADYGLAMEKRYAVSPEDLTVTVQEDQSRIVSFVTKDTNIAVTVAAAKSGGIPPGYEKYITIPKDSTNLVGNQLKVSDLPSEISLTWTPSEGSRTGYMMSVAYEEFTTSSCQNGSIIDNALIVETREKFPKLFLDEYLAAGLEDGKEIFIQLCSSNSRVPPDVSDGVSFSYQLPDRALATLTGTPAALSVVDTINIAVGGTLVTAYKYDLIAGTAACSAAEYGATWIPVVTPIAETVSQGSHKLCVIGEIAANNVQKVATEFSWVVDTVPPGAFNIQVFTSPTNAASVAITVDPASEAASYKFDLSTSLACDAISVTGTSLTTAYTYPTFTAGGTWYVCVSALDAAGNVKLATNNGLQLVIDLDPPVFTSIDLISDAADTWINSLESVLTNDLAGNLVGSGYDTAAYALVTSATTCNAALTYGIVPKSNAVEFTTDGAYKVCVKLSETSGNITFGTSATVTRDTVAPVFTSVSLDNDAANLYINFLERSNTTDLVSGLTGTGYLSSGYKLVTDAITCNGALTFGAIPKSDSTDFIGDGDYKVCVTISDLAGNVTYGNSTGFTLDTVLPVFTSISLAFDATDGYINLSESVLTNDLVSGLVGSGHSGENYKLVTNATTCDGVLTYGLLPTSNAAEFIGDGTYKVCVELYDAAGNKTWDSSSSVVRDTAPPVFTSVTLANDAVGAYINLAESVLTNDLVSGLSATAYDTAEYQLVTFATVCSSNPTWGAVPKSDAAEFTVDGSYKVCVKLSDSAGNSPAYGASLQIDRDTVVPAFTSINLINTAADGYINISDNTGSADLVGGLTGSDYDSVDYKLSTSATTCSGATPFGATVPKGNSADFTGQGTFKVCVRLTDLAANPAAFGESAALEFDTAAPGFTSLALANDALDGYINISESSLTNNLSGVLVASGFNSDAYKLATTATTCNVALTYGIVPLSNAAEFASDGSFKICIKLLDLAGNATYNNSPTIIRDTVAPTFTSISLANDAANSYINLAESVLTNDLVSGLAGGGYDLAEYQVVAFGTTCSSVLIWGALPKNNAPEFTADGAWQVCVKLSDTAGNTPAYGSSAQVNRDTVAPVFTSIDSINDAADGYINANENAGSTALVGGLNAANYDTVEYRLTAAANTCSAIGLYFAPVPNSDAAEFSTEIAYKVCIRLKDNAGNTTAYGSSANITYDITAPVFTSVSLANDAIDGYINSSEHLLTTDLVAGLSASGYSMASYKLVAFATACDDLLTYGALPKSDATEFSADANYKICVELVDTAGNKTWGTGPSIVLDTVSPTFTSIAIANDAVDGFINFTENALTNDLVSGLIAAAYDTVQYKLVTDASTCSAVATWGTLPKSNDTEFSSQGLYKVCVKLTDTAGNTPTYGASAAFEFDTVSPVFTSISLANDAADGYISAAENALTNDLASGLSASGYSAVTYKLSITATACSVATPYGGAIPKSNSADFSGEGNHKVCVKLVDTAGNPATFGASLDIVLDTLPPTFTSLANINDAADNYINLAESSQTNDLVGSLSATGHNTAEYKLVTNVTTCNVALTYGIVPKSNAAEFTTDGMYKTCVKLTDTAGNISYATGLSITRDISLPTFTSIALANDATDGYINLGETALTNDLVSTLVASGYTAAAYKIAAVAVTCNNALTYAALPKSNSSDFSSDASYKVCVRVSDDAANYAYGNSNTIELDKTIPAASVVSSTNPNASYGATSGINVQITFSENVYFSGLTGAITYVLETGTTDRTAAYQSGNATTVIDFTYTVQAGDNATPLNGHASTPQFVNTGDKRLKDLAGNEIDTNASSATQLSASKTINIDTTAPSAFSITDPTAAQTVFDNTYTVVWSDPGDAVDYDVKIDGNSGCPSPEQTYSSVAGLSQTTTTLADGVWFVCVLARDAAGNTSNAANNNLTFTVATGTWTATTSTAAPSTRNGHTAVWDSVNSRMIIWGGHDGTVEVNTGGEYTPAPTTGSWTSTDTGTNLPDARKEHSAVWTGTQMIIWGGFNATNDELNTGSKYTPGAGPTYWADVTTTGAPGERRRQTAVWDSTSSKMMVWGGSDGGAMKNDGGLYAPGADSWTATDVADPDLPGAREEHSAVWTGTYMIVWGGTNGATLNTGGRFDPAGPDYWLPVTTTGAPVARKNHTAIWTGSRMVIFGGHDGTVYRTDGGIYNPGANSWTAINSTDSATARSQHIGIWDSVASRMIVWGGTNGSALGSGAALDPSANIWTVPVMQTTGAPAARYGATAVLGGSEVIIWGGSDGSVLQTGAKYTSP